MNKILFIPVLLVLALVCAAGCVAQPPAEPTPTATPAPTASPTSGTGFSLVPGPVDAWPGDLYQVTVTANRDARTPAISVVYSGGAGTDWIKHIDVTLYRADDEAVITQQFGAQPRIGTELIFTGSSKTFAEDRIKVVAYYDTGKSLVISDKLYKYKSAGY
ncbi:MAG: hypothetical protein Q4Q04_03790 [Methanocorpusculum sp.]|nr:hypothetical protein [Methanocorpusculum sp.]